MSELIISVSGLRGIVGQSLTPEVAAEYVKAFAAVAPPGPIVITRDGRASGPMLSQAIIAALHALGWNTINVGVAATPTTGVLVRHLAAAGGVQISASHNPAEYNGLKLFNADGRVIPADEGQRVLDCYREPGPLQADTLHAGRGSEVISPVEPHWQLVRDTVDVDRIRAREFRVLLDANHGAGGALGRLLLEELGCEVTVLGAAPDGQFEHLPEPTAENLAGVLARVCAVNADIGFCQDPDADRLAVIDERGRYLGEEYTLAMCVDHVLRDNAGPVVTNCSTSRMSEDIAAKYNAPFSRTAVGEANVVDRMIEVEAAIGGEGNGGVIDPRVGLVRDSFAGMALLLDAMARRGMAVSALAGELPQYTMVKSKVTLPRERIQAAIAALARTFPDARQDRLDGLRIDWPGAWLLVRASNTEPIVRIMTEAPTAAEAQRLADEARTALAGV